MAYSISVCDTHRIPYPNATVKAYKLGSAMETTDQIKFKHGKNGTELGFEIKTNARGYFCDNNGDLYTNGVFVSEDAIVKVTMGDGTSTTWEVLTQNDVPINDGKLLGTKNKDNDELEEKWSANSADNYILNYDHLINKPRVNEWMEVEQIVTMDKYDDEVDVDKYAKTITITAENGVAPLDWTLVNGNYKPVHADNPNTLWALKLKADSTRVGQVVCIRNMTGWRLAIKNSLNEIITVIPPIMGADEGKFVALYGNSEPSLPFRGVVDLEHLGMTTQVVLDSTTPMPSAVQPIVINDFTPDVFVIEIKNDWPYSNTTVGALYLKSEVTKPRRLRVMLRNFKMHTGFKLVDVTSGNAVIGAIADFTLVELKVTNVDIMLANYQLRTAGIAFDVSSYTASVELPPEATFITGTHNGTMGSGVQMMNDTVTDKMIYGFIGNSTTQEQRFTMNFAGAEIEFYLAPGVINTFVVHKMGAQFCVLKGTAGSDDRYMKVSFSSHPNNADYYYKVSKTTMAQDTVCVNIPYLMQAAGENWWDFGGSNDNDNLVFDVSGIVPIGETRAIRFKVDAYCKGENTGGGSHYKPVFIGFGDENAHDLDLVPLSRNSGRGVIDVSRKTIIVWVTRDVNGYSVVYGLVDTTE